MISSVSPSVVSTPYIPKVTASGVLDKVGGLYEAKLPDSSDEDLSTGFVYSAKGLTAGAPVPGGAIYLKDTEGAYFSLSADKINMVASGNDLNLYVYADDGTADQYTFGVSDGKLKSAQPTTLNAVQFSKVEVTSNRDLDGNTGIGAALDKTSGDTAGTLDVPGGLFRVKSMGQNLFVVGKGLEKSKVIDASQSTLLTSEGAVWAPPEEDFTSFRVASVTTKAGTNWTVYGADAQGQTTQFKFDGNKKLIDSDTKVLTARELASLEKQTLRDLNADNSFGVEITTTPDSKSGLYKGKVLEQDFYLVGAALKSGTAKAGTDLTGSLLNTDGEAWAMADGYEVGALVKNKTGDAAYSLYAYSTAEGGKNDVLRFDFSSDAGNFKVTSETADGLAMDATALASAEKSALRDLNADTVFGVKIDGDVDKVGGLYKASALGNDFLLVGKSLTSSASKPLDLSAALRNADGGAWKPDDVETVGSNLKIVNKGNSGYDVYVKEDAGTFAKYSFGTDYVLKANGDREELSREALATAEKSLGRDLNGDSAFGVKVDSLDLAKGGLYRGSFEDQTKVYLRSESKLTLGSKVAANGIDLSAALQTAEGYWDVEEGYKVTAAYTTNDNEYVVVATADTDTSDLRKYTFDIPGNKLIEGKSGDMSVIELAAAEKLAGRDLNGDTIKAVNVKLTLDKVGGLHKVGAAGATDFYSIGAKSSEITDLSKALLNADGTAWAPPGGETDMVLSTLKTNAAVTGYDVYAKATNGSITLYSFDDKYTYKEDKEDNAKVLSLMELADAEKTIQRDINGDKSIGAVVAPKPIDKAGGLYTAKIGGEAMTIVSSAAPGKTTSLGDKVLLDALGNSPWKVDAGFSLKAAYTESNGNISVYANKDDDVKVVKRYTFDSTRVFSEAEDLTADQMVKAEKTAGRDLNADQAVGLKVATVAIDNKGGLYKASLLGKDFFVLGQTLKTGKDAATAVDLSKALLDGDGNAWDVATGFTVGGVVKNTDGSADVYTFKKTGDLFDVKKDTWDKNMQFVESAVADPVALVEVEATAKRDFSGDGFVGFSKLSTPVGGGFQGVTEAKVSGNVTFLLAGTNLRSGTPTNPLTLKDALLNEDGSGPWQIESGFKIKAVDDTGTDRMVYAIKPGTAEATEEVKKFTFSKTTGRVSGEGASVSAVELAAREVLLKKDLNGDTKNGVATVADVTADVDGKSRSTGLLKATVMGKDYLVINKVPQANQNISLAKALLSTDGTTGWAVPEGFSVKGVYQPEEKGPAEVYGLNADNKIVRFKFDAVEGSTSLTLKSEEDDARIVSGTDLAKQEAVAKKDLNGDASIGFKVTNDKVVSQSNGWTLGKAGVNAETDSEIYIVGKNLGKMGSVATNLANNAALFDATAAAYWKPDEGYSVVSVVQTADSDGVPNAVNLYAKKGATDDTPISYLKYKFTQTDGNWTLDSAGPANFTSQTLVGEEATTKRDLNNDSAVGLTVLQSGTTAGLSKAEIDDQTFFLVGNLSTGTGTRPQDISKLLTGTDDKAWKPTDGETLSNWRSLSIPLDDATPTNAKFALNVGETVQYFDADYKNIAAGA
jgi:hypothetical protein